MTKLFTESNLVRESKQYLGTGGNSQGNGEYGFIPAFMDTSQGNIYLSRHSDGSLAKIHLLDGIPEHLIISTQDGRVTTVKESIVAGFVLNEIFYTRDEAAKFVTQKIVKSA